MLTAVIRDEQGGQVVGVVVASPKAFATGSRGYHGQGKVEIAGRKYQAQLQLVEIGSKGQAEGAEEGPGA
jgi:hypothetical protein